MNANELQFQVGLDTQRALERLLDHPWIWPVGIPDPRGPATKAHHADREDATSNFDPNLAPGELPPRLELFPDRRAKDLWHLVAPKQNRGRQRVAAIRLVPDGHRAEGSADVKLTRVEVHLQKSRSTLVAVDEAAGRFFKASLLLFGIFDAMLTVLVSLVFGGSAGPKQLPGQVASGVSPNHLSAEELLIQVIDRSFAEVRRGSGDPSDRAPFRTEQALPAGAPAKTPYARG